jgi:hypothetical protein
MIEIKAMVYIELMIDIRVIELMIEIRAAVYIEPLCDTRQS